MPNETKISKLSTKTGLSKLGSKTSKLEKLESFKSKLGKAQAKRISLDSTFIGKTSFELNDNLFIVDDFKASIGYPESFNDSVTTEDNIRVGIKINFADGISVEDVATISSILNKVLLSDGIETLDSISPKVSKLISFLDSLTPEDVVNYGDKLALSDTILIDETFLNTLLNSVNFDDDVDILQTFSNALNNSINLETEPDIASVSDGLTVTVDMVEQPNDSVSVDESFSAKLAIPVSLSDSTTVEDNINVTSDLVDSFEDFTTLEDVIADKLGAKVVLNDNVSTEDEFTSIANFVTSFIGTVTTNEEFNFGTNEPVIIPEPVDAFNVETDTYNTSISYFIYGVFVNDEIVAIVIRNPLPIQVISPLSLSQNLGNLTFQWQADEFSNQYELQVGTSPNFPTGIVINQTAITGTSYTPTSILANNTYYWRVRGKNTTNGKFGPWTLPIQFSVISLATPQIIFPANNQKTKTAFTATWTAIPEASEYDYDLYYLDGALQPVYVTTGTTSNTSYSISGLEYNKTYYFRVRSKNGNILSAYDTHTFIADKLSLSETVATNDNIAPKLQTTVSFDDDSVSVGEEFISDVLVSAITTDIYPYQLLSDDPTTKTIINWIDDSNIANGEEQTLQYYPANDTNNVTNLQITSTIIPNTTKYTYSAKLSGLTAGVTYNFKILKSGFQTNLYTFKTFKSTLGADTLRVAFLSDIHIDYQTGASMYNSNRMAHVRSENPDILCLIGDIVSNSHTPDLTKSNLYITFFREHINTHMSTNRVLVPMVNVPGNHDVGELNVARPKTAGYFQLFWNTFKEYNSGNNHGTVKVGNYLKLVGMDLFSSDGATNATMINNLTDDTEYVIPFGHFPILPSTLRNTWDTDIYNNTIQTVGLAIGNNDKIKAYFTGHMHTRYNSMRWKVVNSVTAPSPNLSLGNNNYITVDYNSITGKKEFGQGYRGNRFEDNTTIGGNTFGNTAWYVETLDTDDSADFATFYVTTLKAGSAEFKVHRYNSDNNFYQLISTDDMFVSTPEPIGFGLVTPEAGDSVPREWTVFKWNPVENAVDGVTTYEIGVTGSTNINTHPDTTRVRSSIGVGTYNTVLVSTNPNVTADSISINIENALKVNNGTTIEFLKSAGVSNYKIQFATDSNFTNLVTGSSFVNGELTINSNEVSPGIYEKNTAVITIADYPEFLDNVTYYFRIRAFVPTDDTPQRSYTLSSSFINTVQKPVEEMTEDDRLFAAFDEDIWE